MKSVVLETWDSGRLTVNSRFAGLLRSNGLTSFDAIMASEQGTAAKAVLKQRTTTRLQLRDGAGRVVTCFLKRHEPAPWKEYVKPLLRLTRPILGARNEWQAILEFHAAGIPTMTPIALGECSRRSFLITEGLHDCRSLAEWLDESAEARSRRVPRSLLHCVAETARTMHAHRLHHQDFYLYHLLVPRHETSQGLYVIDLGRARRTPFLAQRWVIKDLAQLNYSCRTLPRTERLRFLRKYLDRPLTQSDRRFVRRIERKSRAIARHSARHGL